MSRLNNPTATLTGFDQNGTHHSVLLTLSSPSANSAQRVHTHSHVCWALCVCGKLT